MHSNKSLPYNKHFQRFKVGELLKVSNHWVGDFPEYLEATLRNNQRHLTAYPLHQFLLTLHLTSIFEASVVNR